MNDSRQVYILKRTMVCSDLVHGGEFSKSAHNFNAIHIKFPMQSFAEIKRLKLRYLGTNEVTQSARHGKMGKRRLTLPLSKSSYKPY